MPISTIINVSLECDECGETEESSFVLGGYEDMSAEAAREDAMLGWGWHDAEVGMSTYRLLCEPCLAAAEEAYEAREAAAAGR